MKDEKNAQRASLDVGRSMLNVRRSAFSFSSFILPPSSFIPFLLVCAPLLFLFGPALVRGEVFVYRDAAHFYYPLFEWTTREWGAGRIPLWNPQENCGVPVLGEATSSVFYPGKFVFALPLLSFGTRYMLYIVSHVAFAAWAAYVVAKRWGASAPAAAACAVSYACGGSVLFQIYNVVFLVSAAWLPLAFFAAEKMLAERSWKQAVLFGVVLAMMVLGGDPQTAYHAGLLAALFAGILFCRERPPWRSGKRQVARSGNSRNATESVPYRSPIRRMATTRPVLLGLAATVGGVLAAVQILPAIEWSRVSDRAVYERPRSVYEAGAYLQGWALGQRRAGLSLSQICKESVIGLGGTPASGTHHEAIYEYSQSPWRLTEAIWPNVSGRPFPVNRRWISAIPAEGRSWTPSIYAGLLPLLMALGSLRFWRGESRERWLSWTLLLSVLASLGWFGFGWLAIEIRAAWSDADPEAFPLGAPTGGLYWLLVTVLPGYAQFRYPAKWLVPAALALSLLAAQGWDRAFAARPGRMRLALLVLGAFSACGLVVAIALRSHWAGLISNAPDDDYFGPLDSAGSWNDLAWGLGQTILLCSVFWWLLGRVNNHSGSSHGGERPPWRCVQWTWVALAITVAELVFARSGLIATAPNELWTTPSSLAARMTEQDARDGILDYRVFRTSAEHWPSRAEAIDNSRNRQQDLARWERETLFPKYHLLEGEARLSLVESSGTMKSHDFAAFMAAAREHVRPKRLNRETPYIALNVLSAKYIVRSKREFRDMRESWLRLPEETLWYNPDAWPRAHVVHRAYRLDPILEADGAWEVIMGLAYTPLEHGVVESSTPLLSDNWPNYAKSPTTLCTIIRNDPQHIEIDTSLEKPGLLVLGDLYYPGWVAQARKEESGEVTPLPIVRTNRIMRGVFLPAGKHRVTFSYRPMSFYLGAAICASAWGGLALLGLGRLLVRRTAAWRK